MGKTAFSYRKPSSWEVCEAAFSPPLPLEGGSVHASPFPWKGQPSAARRGWLPFLRRSRLLFAFPIRKGVVSRKAVFSFRCLHHWGRGTAPAMDRVLSQTAHLRRSFPLFFIPLEPYPSRFARHLPHAGKALFRGYRFPIQPPPLRATSFHRKEGVSTRAPSLGRGCRAQRGGVGFLFYGQAASSLPSPCRESGVILVPSSTTSIALTRASQRGAGSILRLFDRHAFSGGNPLHSLSNVLPHHRRGQDRPARGIPLCGYSL